MPDDPEISHIRAGKPEWVKALITYAQPDHRKAARQLLNTFVPFLVIWGAMAVTVRYGYPYWITLVLAVPAAALLIRIFIIFHDCCHGSFFTSPRVNQALGYMAGLFTLTPFVQWRWSHLRHHGSFADLDRRGIGDVLVMTVEEYRVSSFWRRLAYRLYRHPLVMFGLGPTFLFAISFRIPHTGRHRHEVSSVLLTNGLITLGVLLACLTIGWRTLLLVQAPIFLLAWTPGVWLFYVQHQFDGVYWARHDQWDFLSAALQGSSYYRLPKMLQWISGNIGLHHVHHVNPHIPNYHLQSCLDATPELQATQPLTLRSSLRCLRLKLYDEQQRKMVGFDAVQGL